MSQKWVWGKNTPWRIRKSRIPASMRKSVPYKYDSHQYDETDAETCLNDRRVSEISAKEL